MQFTSRLKSNSFSLLFTAILLLAAIAKYRHGLIPVEAIDLAMPYACTRAWMAGLDPYDADVLIRTFNDAGGRDFASFNIKYLPPIYPPITFIVMTPIALLPWEAAVRAWTIAGPVMVGLLLWSLVQLSGMRWRDPRILLLILFCMVFSPLRSTITLTQNALPSVTLALLGAVAVQYRRDMLAGILIALAIGFKLQDALFVLVYFALTQHWRTVGWAVGALAVMSIVAIAVPRLDPRWIFGVLHWLREGSVPGAIIDISSANEHRYQMIHLPLLLTSVIRSPAIVSLVNFLLCGVLALLACAQIVRDPDLRAPRRPNLLALGVLGVLSLLPLYHRFPDAIILLLPMTWAISRLATPQERYARVILILLLPFLLQPYEIIRRLISRESISRDVAATWWFELFIQSSMIWLILLLLCWLIHLLSRRPATNARPSGEDYQTHPVSG